MKKWVTYAFIEHNNYLNILRERTYDQIKEKIIFRNNFFFFFFRKSFNEWLPQQLSGERISLQFRKHMFNPWVGNIPWSMKWQPTLVFLTRKSHEQRNLADYSPWVKRESDMTEQKSTGWWMTGWKAFQVERNPEERIQVYFFRWQGRMEVVCYCRW